MKKVGSILLAAIPAWSWGHPGHHAEEMAVVGWSVLLTVGLYVAWLLLRKTNAFKND